VSVLGQQILDYIKTYIHQHGYAPTIREIAERFNTATSNAWRHVGKLARAGKIVKTRRQARSIRLPAEDPAGNVSRETSINPEG
jgi:SOS-response transcriptional repressor LexA